MLAEAVEQLRAASGGIHIVVDDRGRLQGLCSAEVLAEALAAGGRPQAPLSDISLTPADIIAQSRPLPEAVRVLFPRRRPAARRRRRRPGAPRRDPDPA